jgi:SSS family solute:Na+ symporter
MTVVDYATIVVFLVGVFWLGSSFYRWVGTPDDFYVAGRQLTPFILAASMTTANISLFSLIGVSGTAYQSGISIIWLTWTGNMALVFSGLFVIPVLRRLRIRTIPEFLEMRYNGAVRILVGVLWVFRLAFWIAVVLYAGVTAAQQLTGISSFTLWILVFALIVVVYTTLGGMWSVVLTNNLGFLLMMCAVLTVLPMAMRAAGWWPGLSAHLPPHYLQFVTQSGRYNWKFVLAILALGVQWATLDQGLLQSAFSARDPRVVSKGMVLSAVMITPFAFLWITPGLAARILYPGLPKGELAIPTLIVHLLPAGVLGFVTCGFMASLLSTIGSNLGAVATLMANDIYGRFLNRKASPRQLLIAVRLATVLAGLLTIGLTYLVPYLGGAVDAYLTVISIMDMPLFVIAIPFGLLWKRTTWQGAMAGYVAGSVTGAILKFALGWEVAPVTIVSGVMAAIVCPLVTLMTSKPGDAVRALEPAEEAKSEAPSLRPPAYAIGTCILALGFAIFLGGVLMAGRTESAASATAVGGMVVYFAGGLIMAKVA